VRLEPTSPVPELGRAWSMQRYQESLPVLRTAAKNPKSAWPLRS
jgi:hypothetical protein